MSSKSKKRYTTDQSLTKAVSNAFYIFLWSFCEEFSPDIEVLNRLSAQMKNVRESVMCGALTIPQIRKAIKDDYGLEV